MKFQDWMSKTDLTSKTYFPFEPKGDIFPKKTKNVITEHSIPSHTDPALGTITYLPSVESIKDQGVDPNGGKFSLSGSGMPQATAEAFNTFYETPPPDNTFLYYRARANSQAGITYLVDILDFDWKPHDGRLAGAWSMELKNLGVVT